MIDPITGRLKKEISRPASAVVPRKPQGLPIMHTHFDWFPIRVFSGKEEITQIMMEDRGLTTFVPRETVDLPQTPKDRVERKVRRGVRVWLPGLMFVGMDPGHYLWHVLREVPNFLSILTDVGWRIKPMSHTSMSDLIETYSPESFVPADEQPETSERPDFDVGDMVCVVGGPLDGESIKVEEIDGDIARVFGTFFGATRGFEIGVENLRKIE
ncbi:MAG: transcription termination/antitermination NusG family protein [Pseudomonadota bacterium]